MRVMPPGMAACAPPPAKAADFGQHAGSESGACAQSQGAHQLAPVDFSVLEQLAEPCNVSFHWRTSRELPVSLNSFGDGIVCLFLAVRDIIFSRTGFSLSAFWSGSKAKPDRLKPVLTYFSSAFALAVEGRGRDCRKA